MRSLIALLTFISVVIPTTTAFAMSETSHDILVEARALSVNDQRAAAEARLVKRPRAQVLQAMRDGLAEGNVTTPANAATVLHLTELAPDFAKVQDADAVLALRSLALESQRESLAKQLLRSAKSSDQFPYRNEVYRTLGVWQIPLSDQDFADGLKDPILEVRQAIVENFLSARAKLSVEKQIARYRASFAVKPAQVRRLAMSDFASLAQAERKKLHSVLDVNFIKQCAQEAQADVKAICSQVLKGGP